MEELRLLTSTVVINLSQTSSMHLIPNFYKLRFVFHLLNIMWELSCVSKPTYEAAIQEVPLDLICIPVIW